MTKERKRLVTLLVLLGVLASVLVYNWQTADSESNLAHKGSGVQRANGNGAAPSTVKKVVNGAPGQAGIDGAEGYRPLPLYALKEQGSASDEAQRNIFVYYVPPPPEVKIPQGPPPTIALSSLSPDSVYARTGDFTLRVKGAKMPEDAKIFLNGQEQATQLSDSGELTASVSKSRIASQGKLVVEVKNGRGDFSNALALNVLEPPAPSYAYVGRIDNLVFLRSGDDRYAVRVGSLVDEKKANRWRVISATDSNLIVQDVMIGLNHRLDMDLGQTASSGNQNQAPFNNRPNRVRQIQPVEEGDDEEFQQQLEQEQLQQIQMQQQLQLQQQQLQMMQQQQLYQQQLQQQQRPQPGQPQQYWPQQQQDPQQQRLLEALQMRQKLLQQQQQQQQRNNNRRPNQ